MATKAEYEVEFQGLMEKWTAILDKLSAIETGSSILYDRLALETEYSTLQKRIATVSDALDQIAKYEASK